MLTRQIHADYTVVGSTGCSRLDATSEHQLGPPAINQCPWTRRSMPWTIQNSTPFRQTTLRAEYSTRSAKDARSCCAESPALFADTGGETPQLRCQYLHPLQRRVSSSAPFRLKHANSVRSASGGCQISLPLAKQAATTEEQDVRQRRPRRGFRSSFSTEAAEHEFQPHSIDLLQKQGQASTPNVGGRSRSGNGRR